MVYSYYVCSLNLSSANVFIKMNLRRTADYFSSRLFAQTMAVNAEFEHFVDTILKLRYTIYLWQARGHGQSSHLWSFFRVITNIRFNNNV